MKKLLFMTDSLGCGGAERVLISILEALDPKEFDVTVFLLFKQGIYLDCLPPYVKLKYLCLGNDPLKSLLLPARILYKLYRRVLLELNRLLKGRVIYKWFLKESFDTEVSFIEGETCLYVANSDNPGSKKIAWIHTDLIKRKTISREKEKASLGRMDQIICVSHGSKHSVLSLYPELGPKVSVIYNPVNEKEILEKSREPIMLHRGGANLICVGRLEKAKGFDILIKAHRMLLDEGVKHHLNILGEGSLKGELQRLVNNLNLCDTVIFWGYRKNPYPYMAAGDILVISSLYEGLPLVLMEGMILEKPIISTRCTGPSEILEDQYGLMVEPGDAKSLKDAMKLLVLDESLRRHYSEKSKIRWKALVSENTMKTIISHLEKEQCQ